MSIPASQIVSVNPNVVSAGGAGLALSALVLTNGTRIPIGSVLTFPTAASVGAYFGPLSPEAGFSNVYFSGFDNSNIKPGAILFASYPTAAAAAFLRGGSLATSTLTQLQALTGALSVTVNGTLATSAAINLATATSFSNAAVLIQAGFTAPPFTVTFDSVSSAFVITSSTTGIASTISFATGTLSASLALTQVTGAVLSQGAIVAVPAANLTSISQVATNWATLASTFDPDLGVGNTQKQAIATWVSQQNNRYAYVAWDGDITATLSATATTSLGYLLEAAEQTGSIVVYGLDYTKAAFICGLIASIDFTQHNGRATLAFKSQAGLPADITTPTAAANLVANSYNYYGAYATASQGFVFLYPGVVTGLFEWADSYINQIWLNNALQQALVTLLTNVKSVPYNPEGYALIRAACTDPILAAVNFGAIRQGVPLSALQAASVNASAGLQIDKTLSSQGWYLQILPASALSRGQRKTPPCSLWYMDGGSVQAINLASVEVQ